MLERRPVDLTRLVITCVREQRLLAPSRVFEVEMPNSAASGAPKVIVDADPDRLDQVLTNYLTNAVRYAPEDQPIKVSLQVIANTREDGGGQLVRVAVRDQGPGIAAEDQKTIWERFQRASSLREANGGLGLGLNIVRTIIELHGGQVGVDSSIGAGSTFWFTLQVITTRLVVS